MRFLSPHPGYSVQVFSGEERVEHEKETGQAYTLTVQKPLVAHFEAGFSLFPHEVELALERFTSVWNGLPENVNPATKIAVWDSEAHKLFSGWSDEYHDKVVARLQVLAEQNPSRLAAVAEKWQPKPWPKYDKQDAEEILTSVETLGIDPESVRLYEGENAKRDELLEALSALANGEEASRAIQGIYTPPAPGSGDPETVPAVGDVVAVVEA